MKIKVVNNRCFTLSVEDTEFVLNTYIKPLYPDHNFMVKKSNSTNSIYIFIEYEGQRTSVRLSNHPNSYLKYHYISPNTKVVKIVRIIVNSIQLMHDKHLSKILNEI